MPTDTVILLGLVIAVFAVFAVVLLWADRQTQNLPKR